jgi:hypothetical protein
VTKQADGDWTIDVGARLIGLEIIVTALAQRDDHGGQALAAALLMSDALTADLMDHEDLDAAARHAEVLRGAHKLIHKVAVEVRDFRRGSGIEKIG